MVGLSVSVEFTLSWRHDVISGAYKGEPGVGLRSARYYL